jgi:hypothetical protein
VDQKIPTVLEQNTGNLSELVRRVIELQPRLSGSEREFRQFCRSLVKLVGAADPKERHVVLEKTREDIRGFTNGTATKKQLALKFACSVVIDMVAQGWELWVGHRVAQLKSPKVDGVGPDELKQRVREGHLLERDAQLREPSVREFIKEMERRRLGPKGWVSVFSLMRDGRELGRKLQDAAPDPVPNRRADLLRSAISPYLQVVESGAKCELTGIPLTDIWRYFRHTWVSTYKSLPGRSMMVLIRDSAAPFHPVIGIAALGSSMAQQTQRDQWIGWDSEVFVQGLSESPKPRMARWVHSATDRLIKSIYIDDFLSEGVIKRRELRSPTARTVSRLLRLAERASGFHVLNPDAAKHKNAQDERVNAGWKRQAKTALFRSKRAKALAKLLGIREALFTAGVRKDSAKSLKGALTTPTGRLAIRQLVRAVKSEHVGVDMMDIIVCGAVAPYNAVLGGKLVCLLLCSPEVVRFYRSRYGQQSSIIASSMKGKSVVRPPNLVLLATTSLYGVGSSQYDRLRVPLEGIGGKHGQRIEYLELGVSKGYGSYHFSRATIDYLETLLGRAGDGRKVNSIFGEGVNPLMRKIRDGLAEIGLPSDELMRHGNARVVYAIPLADNFRDVLLGLARRPSYFLSLRQAAHSTQLLVEFWRKRWLSGRITRPGILEAVEKHSLAYPITHGARVTLPSDGEPELFDEATRP